MNSLQLILAGTDQKWVVFDHGRVVSALVLPLHGAFSLAFILLEDWQRVQIVLNAIVLQLLLLLSQLLSKVLIHFELFIVTTQWTTSIVIAAIL